MHQIRRHFAHLRHYIIGDSTHGDNKQNKFFRQHFQSNHLLLHAWLLQFNHPYTGEEIEIKAEVSPQMEKIIRSLGWKNVLEEING
jgi:tRNA pseudouridine65 synthase